MTTSDQGGAPESARTADPAGGQGEGKAPDPVAAAAERVLARDAEDAAAATRRGPGRPRGSKTRNRSRDRDRARNRERERPAADPAPAGDTETVPPAEPTDGEVRVLAKLLGSVWRIAGARLRRRPLTDSEATELARDAHPVIAKYGGAAATRFGPEIALGFSLWSLWEATAIPPEPDQLAEAPETLGDAVAGV